MAELLEVVASWPSLLLVLLVFGFAPGFCLRLIVLVYARRDPRRTELVAELYTVPRIQRPLWVAEQIEVALFEGLGHRASAAIRRLTELRQARAQTNKRSALAFLFWAGLLIATLSGSAVLMLGRVTEAIAVVPLIGLIIGSVLVAFTRRLQGDAAQAPTPPRCPPPRRVRRPYFRDRRRLR